MAEETVPGLFTDIKFYVVGNVDDQIIKHLTVGGAKKDTYLSEAVTHVICDNCENHEYGEAKDLFELPVVTSRWVLMSIKCKARLPLVGFDPEANNFFSKVTATCSGVSKMDAAKLWAMLSFYGGKCVANLNPAVTHLICFKTEGAKYEMASKKGIAVVCPDWVVESVKRQKAIEVRPYHPKYLVSEVGPPLEDNDKKPPPSAPPATIGPARHHSEEVQGLRQGHRRT